ncbi:hypothetical protein ACFOLJ_11665 [Rugamonas sp. CCM 8940]|uniref:hypothetical protein n=1 Tax=Rugamonas sp. CCM 8940 TaxID=2765359 RepID=UPI0018F6F67E|nr:hypothetical protein [Rugamonas sp. CCM 8940]MBJ7311603.1 hypothetical protein [Rugamonas sp. CCM 8940]
MRQSTVPLLSLSLAVCLAAGCSEAPPPAPPYPAISAGCAQWQDSASLAVADSIHLNVSTPRTLDDGGVELVLAYFLPANSRADLARTGFELTLPHGAAIASGRIGQVERLIPPVGKDGPIVLPGLPPRLLGEAYGADVIYRFPLRFAGPLPERFDLTPPAMTIAGVRYPMRTLTLRRFAQRGAVGLCS